MLVANPIRARTCAALIPVSSVIAGLVVTHVAWSARKIPLKKGSIRGFHPGRPGSAGIQFESLLECGVIADLVRRPELVSLQSQPFTVHFEVDGKRHRYTPDLMVQLSTVPADLARLGFDRLTIVECKPRHRLAHCAEELERARVAIADIMSAPFVVIVDPTMTAGVWEEVNHAA